MLPAPVEGLERRLSRRIASGRAQIQSTIDLHGMTWDEARTTLVRHIEKARRRGDKRVLVITGKGRDVGNAALSPGRPGVLRQALPDWLRGDDLAHHVVAFEPARPQHGGSGAFYIQLRGKL
jgi:DNA-nicking Smr family endonuclease